MRLDKRLVEAGFVQGRGRAQALIKAGHVYVDGVAITKPAQDVGDDAAVKIEGISEVWVSRAAQKLVHGLDIFGIDPRGAVALDVGASTGGFTQVLLSRGAAHVYALDVGYGQLHPQISDDPRVTNMERTNARDLAANTLPLLDIIVSDVSFISLSKALPVPLSFAKGGARLVALIKPQFEVGPALVGKGGIVKDQTARDTARADVAEFLQGSGWRITGETTSPVTGSDGNIEYLIGAVREG